jgi:DNA-binding CsgD family transcriptional regulator
MQEQKEGSRMEQEQVGARRMVCACPGCRGGGTCYLKPEQYEFALRSSEPVRRLMAHTLRMVTAAVACARIAFATVDERAELCDIVSLDTSPPRRSLEQDWEEYVLRYRKVDPFSPARHVDSRRAVVTIDDLGGRQAFDRSEYGREFLPELGFSQELCVYMRDGVRMAAALVLTRKHGEPPFASDDVAFLRRAQPAIELAYACAVARQPAVLHAEALRGKGLTPREIDVAKLVAGGGSNRDVARTLLLSESTIKTHLKRVYAKLDVHSRTQLALLLGGEWTER